MRPARLNSAIASLFIVGSACFALGSVPAYADAVGGTADGVTFFVGSIFFTTASFLQLVQAQTPAMTGSDAALLNLPEPVRLWSWLPHDRPWLVASAFGILAVGTFWSWRPWSLPWRIAWVNMIGSVLFMASALASFVLPSTGDVINLWVDVAGTMFGALCFLIGAVLMFPAWTRAVRNADPAARPT
jgi:hypothetical protein